MMKMFVFGVSSACRIVVTFFYDNTVNAAKYMNIRCPVSSKLTEERLHTVFKPELQLYGTCNSGNAVGASW
jgi:hypothetical protein